MTCFLTRTLRFCALGVLFVCAAPSLAHSAQTYGPIHVELPGGGASYESDLGGHDTAPITADAWTLSCWIEPKRAPKGEALVAGFGAPDKDARRYFALVDGRAAFITEAGRLVASAALEPNRWHHLAATAQGGQVQLYADGRRVAADTLGAAPVLPHVVLGPRTHKSVFAGRIVDFMLEVGTKGAAALRRQARQRPETSLIAFETGSPSWSVQLQQKVGQSGPQPAATRPTSRAPLGKPRAKPIVKGPALRKLDERTWSLGGFKLIEAPRVQAGGEAISRAGFATAQWLPATVPGTVLTTLLDRGVYPDPTLGLNNMAIPEQLARQDYWYRTEFDLPSDSLPKQIELALGGVNYSSEVWLNGQRLGTTCGAFVRGRFDVTKHLVRAHNTLAVRVSPPPHPGVPHEQSLAAGDGNNGGMLMLDGPTFVATEGWDWIPGIRDRNTGLWQDVTLHMTEAVAIDDVQVVTTLPKSDRSVAEVEITVPLENRTAKKLSIAVHAAFDDVAIGKNVTLEPHEARAVTLSPAEFSALRVVNPRLWWPNGYGEPALHDLSVAALVGEAVSDRKTLRFGMREVTYDLSLMDEDGELERVTVNLNKARALRQPIVDTSHRGIRKSAVGWVMSLAHGAHDSAALTPLDDSAGLAPHLVLRINGVRIAARGGNIGMDDFLKRVERTRLEPMFRLHQDAHLNIVRNWVGQDTEETFFELADEYGMMVLNDFWESTQDVNLETDKPEIFMVNARDVVRRYRNHPSIVLWFGRNEGVPQPALNDALEQLIRTEDGTRLYMGASNTINLQGSGPYNWQPEETYFTTHAKGFSVEVGTPSLPTLEAWQHAMAPADRWPISDAWAYHDWHQTGNGAVTSYLTALETRLGPATDLPSFERKAQLLQYDAYRAIFEGFNSELWTRNSARLLWMTQPAWPSAAWNIFSSDYDTQASFYGVKKACEPVHVQMNLPHGDVMLINQSLSALENIHIQAHVVTPAGEVLHDAAAVVRAAPQETAEALRLDLSTLTARGVALIRLTAHDAAGHLLSSNLYWRGKDDAALLALNEVPHTTPAVSVSKGKEKGETVLRVGLANTTSKPALAIKLTALDKQRKRILPAYLSDNYFSLLPGERSDIVVHLPQAAADNVYLEVRGYNVPAKKVQVR